VPDAIAFQAEHDWDRVRAECRELARFAQQEVTKLSGVPPYHTDGSEWSGQVVCAQLPRDVNPEQLRERLRFEYQIDVSVDVFHGWPRARISIQGYNTYQDVERLIDALKRLL
jgi:isopenicillin-N epimerase